MNEVFDTWCEEEGYQHHLSRKRLFAALRDRGVTDGGTSGSTGTGPASGSGMCRSGLQRSRPCQDRSRREDYEYFWMMQYMPGTMGTMYGFSGKSYEKTVQKKIPEIVKMVSMVPGIKDRECREWR